MDEILKSRYRQEQISLATEIGASTESLDVKILELFRMLHDPLLSRAEIISLLGIPKKANIDESIDKLVSEGSLEFSDETSRPLDKECFRLFRRKDIPYEKLVIIAQESMIDSENSRFVFTCEGRLLRSIARIDRLDSLAGTGAQRDEVRNHVIKIAEGISSGTQVPNSVLLVILKDSICDEENDDCPASFIRIQPLSEWIETAIPHNTSIIAQRVRNVQLEFPFRLAAFDDEKSCLLVDGQQRTAALSMVDIEKVPQFFLSVNAVATDSEEAKSVFRIANNTQKIETQFARALVASMQNCPPHLREEQPRSVAARMLAITMQDSPFFEKVSYPGFSKKKKPYIVYNSLFQVLTQFAESALPLQDNPELLANVVKMAFGLVVDTWPEAWNRKPSESKLTHGVGLRAIAGLIVSKLEYFYQDSSSKDILDPAIWADLSSSLQRLRARIVWTDAESAAAPSAVRKIYRENISNRQNTNQDISALTSFLKKESLSLDMQSPKTKGN